MSERLERRLIEGAFPCGEVGAETQRERGASSSLPPLYFLHVWWARRPLTPSRAAVLASLLPADTDAERFLMDLGIQKRVAVVGHDQWVLTGDALALVEPDGQGQPSLPVNDKVLKLFEAEQKRRRADSADHRPVDSQRPGPDGRPGAAALGARERTAVGDRDARPAARQGCAGRSGLWQ